MGNPDFADKVYIAANLAGKGCTSEFIADNPFVTIGDFTYALDYDGHLCMFPYRKSESVKYGGPVYNRTFWNYGVKLDEEFTSDNARLFDRGGKNGWPGFPYSRVMSLVSDTNDMADLFRVYDINEITG